MQLTEKGICRLSVVPVRAMPLHKSEMVTQLLFGDHYEVIDKSENGQWLKIRIHFDEYEGWIRENQHHKISDEYYEQINFSDYKICTDYNASIYFNKDYIHIFIGSILPIATNELFRMEERLAFNGSSKSLNQKRDFEFVREVSAKFLNAPYLWGGKTPYGIDCSGFVQQVYKIAGYKLKRDTGEQVFQGLKVSSINDSRPGDLAFFSENSERISHVGILARDNKIIHASGKVRFDKIDEKGIFNVDLKKCTHKLETIRRILRYSHE